MMNIELVDFMGGVYFNLSVCIIKIIYITNYYTNLYTKYRYTVILCQVVEMLDSLHRNSNETFVNLCFKI